MFDAAGLLNRKDEHKEVNRLQVSARHLPRLPFEITYCLEILSKICFSQQDF